uniref:Uncharacterized protein n=1 Tax=Arundo donax TaxID=35708 RepID=A0A0A8ZQE4_ARUDO
MLKGCSSQLQCSLCTSSHLDLLYTRRQNWYPCGNTVRKK